MTIADLRSVIGEFSLRDRAIIELILSSGMPTDVLISLNIVHYALDDEIDLGENFIHPWHIEKEKTGIKYMTFSNTETTRSIFRYLYHTILCVGEVSSYEPLFRDENGNRISRGTINTIFKKLSSKIGKNITPHQLRKLFSETLYDNGASPSFIGEILGHYVPKYHKTYYETDDIETVYREVQAIDRELITNYWEFEELFYLENNDYEFLDSTIIKKTVEWGGLN